MIIVAGTHRSGTSMWMQILGAAGLPILGDQFPENFRGLEHINKGGFWETRLRKGINFQSNPDPATGIYLHPEATRHHVLKVFVRGLTRSDHAFLDRVLLTVRPWREYSRSMERLIQAEDARVRSSGRPDPEALVAARAARRPDRPFVVTWWFQLYAGIRDITTRRYPHHIVTYDRLMRDPDTEIRAVVDWIGDGDPEPAIAAVRPDLRTHTSPMVEIPDGVTAEEVALFDEVYDHLDQNRELSPELIRRMNATERALWERYPRTARRQRPVGA